MNTGNKPLRRRPGSRPRTYRDLYNLNQNQQSRPTASAAGLTSVRLPSPRPAPAPAPAEAEASVSPRKSKQTLQPRPMSPGGFKNGQPTTAAPAPAVPISPRKSIAAIGTSSVKEMSHKPSRRRLLTSETVMAMNITESAPLPAPAETAATAEAVSDSDSEWHESLSDPSPSAGGDAGKAESGHDANDIAQTRLEEAEMKLLCEEIRDADVADEIDVYGERKYLQVSNTVIFEPYALNHDQDKVLDQETGCWKTKIKIKNSSKCHFTYMVKPMPSKLYEVSNQIGVIPPGGTKAVIIVTNPSRKYKYQDLSDCSVTVLGHAVFLRDQLQPVAIDAFWRRMEPRFWKVHSIEQHETKWVRPKSDSTLDMYSSLDRLVLLWPFGNKGNQGKHQPSPILPDIDSNTFWTRCYPKYPFDQLAELKFKCRQLERKLSLAEHERKTGEQLVAKFTLAIALTLLTYLFVWGLLYLEITEPPKEELSWFGTVTSSITNGAAVCWGGVVGAYNGVAAWIGGFFN